MAKAPFNWGGDIDDFPSGMFDDFDGKIELIEYEAGEYNTQIHYIVRPKKYEYDARGLDYDEDEDEGRPQQWLSMGGDGNTFEVSDDGMEIESGTPQRNTGAVRWIMKAREALGKSLKLKGSSLEPFDGLEAHFKVEVEKRTNPETKEKIEKPVLYIVGEEIGKAAILAGKKSKSKSDDDEDDDNGDEDTRKSQDLSLIHI